MLQFVLLAFFEAELNVTRRRLVKNYGSMMQDKGRQEVAKVEMEGEGAW